MWLVEQPQLWSAYEQGRQGGASPLSGRQSTHLDIAEDRALASQVRGELGERDVGFRKRVG